MKKLVFLALVLLWIHAVAAEHPDEFYDPDVQHLIAVREFAFGPVGYAGVTSVGEEAFGAILKKKEAVRYVVQVFDHGTPEAQCYALVALREFSDVLYDKCKAQFWQNSPSKITTMSGCIVSQVDTEKVLGSIERGAYRHYFTDYEGGR